MQGQVTSVPRHQQLYFGALLAAIAGSLDAYTYLVHGGVFAGLQTGNCILLGVAISHGNNAQIGKYIIAIIAFVIGVVLIRIVQYRFDNAVSLRRHEIFVLVYEGALLVIVAALSDHVTNLVTTAMLSLVAAGQLQEFRQLNHGPFTSLMMTGNLRTLGESLFNGWLLGQKMARHKAIEMGSIIASFIGGAVLMGLIVPILHGAAILIAALMIGVALLILLLAPHDFDH